MIYRVSRMRTVATWHDVLVRVAGDGDWAKELALDTAEAFLDGDTLAGTEAHGQAEILDDNEPDYGDPAEITWTIEVAADQTKEHLR